jgi:hypothetical protein
MIDAGIVQFQAWGAGVVGSDADAIIVVPAE